nr:hypothetical protein [Tanacetum cinerariifolium]
MEKIVMFKFVILATLLVIAMTGEKGESNPTRSNLFLDNCSRNLCDDKVNSGLKCPPARCNSEDCYYNGANGDVACDGHHKYKEDVQLMVDTGLEAFKLSISWSRLIPNERGKDFVAYAIVCFREFSDRVNHWTTFNEVNVFTLGGYDVCFTPPGRCSSPFGIINCTRGDSTSEPYIPAHNLLLAHASAVKLYRENYKVKASLFHETRLYAKAAQRANDIYLGWNGSNTKGYVVWSFMDLFELLDGYNTGYGLYYVDLDDKDLTRYPKLSSH